MNKFVSKMSSNRLWLKQVCSWACLLQTHQDFLLMVLWNTAQSPLEQRSLFKSTQSSVLYELTQYSTSVHPSMVIHWNTVSIANAKLSKLVMPPLGPTHPPLHSVPFMTHWRPFPENAQGAGSSSTSISGKGPKSHNSESSSFHELPLHMRKYQRCCEINLDFMLRKATHQSFGAFSLARIWALQPQKQVNKNN